ncbi:MAG TPA: hypothetical protein VNC61_11845 [Acidimicrobiales bacterium]|nr:hypothetical protein [Acidimicrobiales bacterium]
MRAAPPLGDATVVAGLATVLVALLPAPVAAAATDNVTNCADSGAGSPRHAVAKAGTFSLR